MFIAIITFTTFLIFASLLSLLIFDDRNLKIQQQKQNEAMMALSYQFLGKDNVVGIYPGYREEGSVIIVKYVGSLLPTLPKKFMNFPIVLMPEKNYVPED